MKDAGHTLWTIKGSNFNVLRNNYFYNTNQKIGEVYDMEDVGFDHEFWQQNCTKYNLIEKNVFAFTPYDSRVHMFNGIQYGGQNGILRNNTFYDCKGGALGMQIYADESMYNLDNRIFHNVFYKNHHGGTFLSNADPANFSGNLFLNNIFYQNDGEAGTTQVLAGSQGFVFQNNNILNQQAGEGVIDQGGLKTLSWAQSNLSSLFAGNVELAPSFMDEANHDFHLKAGSPMIDKGAFLTQTVGAGSGTAMKVKDVGFFYDGFGIAGEVGDTIQLKGQTQTATIVKIDYATNTLTLDKSLTWTDGQGLAGKYSGTSPDLGAWEYNN
jgi:hypothetical protein